MSRLRRHPFSRNLVLTAVAALAVAGCSDSSQQAEAPAAPPPSVTVAKVVSEDVRDSARFVGQIAAVDQVDLVARVNGFLEKKAVPDGSLVKEKDLLFTIEKGQYEAALTKAKADVSSAKADAALKAADEKRDRDLRDKGHLSEAAYEATLAQKEQAAASVEAAQSALQQAELNLSYTDVSAPFPGQIGKTTYSVGEVVGPSTQPLAKLIRLAPVYVNFSVSESQYLNAVKTHGISAEDVSPDNSPDIKLILPNGETYGETGKIVFIGNEVDTSTGTISFRGQFENADTRLLAGTYVTVVLEAPKAENAIVVPQAAIQRDQQGAFALAVTSDKKVEQRYVELGQQVETNFVVTKGLADGDEVIVEGLQKVRPGVEVTPVLASQPAEQS
ncbi:efflux RND transporter periplasmic adaptor subunit [Roseibium denhamense]|uniref:Membrane fusion protein, multidrug efflux system n=1 Tax=Roseibium denhamense TaxID=76305 RepID=A0ABY1PI34_9HYPH|nr:efflux RND transporter periplasmic adaptor subunit [Roseibium denhamense]MTI06198.1 efflux RND transporter periplasmic adaptor subunit [Roseibium denhamense]SMP32493.1 membrane fusion protein, multidrug efflux system [Roseibium denhamense]